MNKYHISAAIMAHPRRAEPARLLREECAELGAQIVFDPQPDGHAATLRTSRLAWDAIDDSATHHLVLQDDVRPCVDFTAQVKAAVESMPDHAVFLYTNWGTADAQTLRLAALEGASWADHIDPIPPAQAVLLPRDIAKEFCDFAGRYRGDDDALALRAFLESQSLKAYVSVPNLVDHRELPSLLGNDVLMGYRRSACFGWPEEDRPRWEPKIKNSPPVVPLFWAGRSVSYVRADARWTMVESRDLLEQRDIKAAGQVADFRHAISQVPLTADCLKPLSESLLFELWLTAFLMGAVATVHPVSNALTRPLAQRAVGTLIAGSLRRVLSPAYMDAVAAELYPLIVIAAMQGEASRLW